MPGYIYIEGNVYSKRKKPPTPSLLQLPLTHKPPIYTSYLKHPSSSSRKWLAQIIRAPPGEQPHRSEYRGRHSTIRHGATESAIAARATANQARVQAVMSTVCGEVGGVADVRVAVCGRVNADEDPDEETVCAKISHLYI